MDTIFHIDEKLQIKISGDTHSSCQFFLNNLKGTKITLLVAILDHSNLSGTNQQIFLDARKLLL